MRGAATKSEKTRAGHRLTGCILPPTRENGILALVCPYAAFPCAKSLSNRNLAVQIEPEKGWAYVAVGLSEGLVGDKQSALAPSTTPTAQSSLVHSQAPAAEQHCRGLNSATAWRVTF
jgi:hypothetical protein